MGLKTGVDEAAVGVLRVVEANMINALKLVSIQRGHDPRDFVLIAAGGGGPMHAASLGRELGVKEIVIPRYPGYFSAWGMLVTEPRRDFVQTALIRASEITIETIHELFRGLRAEAEDYFRSDPTLPSDALAFECRIDLRYLGPGALGDGAGRARGRYSRAHPGRFPRRARARLHLPPRRHAG